MHLVLFRLQSLMMEPLGIQIRGVMMKLVMPLMLKMRLLVRKLAMTGKVVTPEPGAWMGQLLLLLLIQNVNLWKEDP